MEQINNINETLLLNAVFDTAISGIVVINHCGIVKMINPAVEELTGYTRDELVGQNVSILTPEPHRSQHNSYLKRFLDGGEPRIIGKGREVVAKRKDGSDFAMHLSISHLDLPSGAMFLGMITDISERKEAEDELAKSHAELERKVIERTAELSSVIDTASDAVITLDAEATVRSFNPAAESLFRCKADDIIGHTGRQLISNHFGEQVDNVYQEYLTHGKQTSTTLQHATIKRFDDSECPVRISIGFAHTEYQQLFVIFIQDITDNISTQKDLLSAKEDAENAAQAKSAFLANMSHEIRTPMNAILGFLGLSLEHEELPKDIRKQLSIAHRSARSLLLLLNDILDISKMESGKLLIEKMPFSINEINENVLANSQVKAQSKDIGLRFSNKLNDNKLRILDPTRLTQVLTNLVDNGIKFTSEGEVLVTIKEGSTHDELHFSVSDTGIGIPEHMIDAIFEQFTQADVSTTRNFGGTGLGTAISKQLVELMGGNIWLESEIDKGSTFHFTIKAPISDEHSNLDDSPLVANKPPARGASQQSYRILAAEDLEVNFILLNTRLKQHGHVVDHAENGKIAFELAQKNHYDVILMDVQMPEMDGLDATSHIRQHEKEIGCENPVPIIALTASILESDRKNCFDVGMNDIVAKPIDFDLLFNKMDDAIINDKHVGTTATTDAKQSPAKLSDCTLIHYSRGMATWQDEEVYQQCLNSFADDLKTKLPHLQALINDGNIDEAKQLTHALKGVAGNLALTDVHARITAFEKAILAEQGIQNTLNTLLDSAEPVTDYFNTPNDTDADNDLS